jgi:2-oxoglutarate dehydrogenase E1 component
MSESERAGWADFSGANAAFIQDLYDQFRADPASVDPTFRRLFEESGAPPLPLNGAAPGVGESAGDGAVNPLLAAGAVSLANAIRGHGHKAADLDPLGQPRPGDEWLQARTYGVEERELAQLPAGIVGGPAAERARNALEAIRNLRRVYQGATGYEFEHLSSAEERAWLREAVETGRFGPPNDPVDEMKLLQRLTEVGSLERFFHAAFPGQTRFSLEGLGMMIPMLDEIIAAAAAAGCRSVFLGMAHRGRLNVLAHILGKPYDQMIGEFMGMHVRSTSASEDGWTGDVKYHAGGRRAYRGGGTVAMSVNLAPNPSHLEWVNPVVEGMCRAADEGRVMPGPARQDELSSMALLIHGDAAFPGQGVVAETLNLSRLTGYRTGGTVHLIANNQLGFTTAPENSRSTLYAGDLAKGFEIPIIHVNADRPEACIAAARLAHAYRHRFKKDVLLDLIGYRRWGHNEGDEPTFTQPLLYQTIREHPSVRQLWARQLMAKGVVTREEADRMMADAIERLHAIRRDLAAGAPKDGGPEVTSGREAGGAGGGLGKAGISSAIVTAVPRATLTQYNDALYAVPAGFRLHPKLEKTFATRRALIGPDTGTGEDGGIEWAHAEALAFASILAEGTPIRLTGQDSRRGTFSQRHAALYDYETGAPHIPLQAHPAAQASFEVWDSPLSEQATLGFEFGYSVQAPEALVLWEAQYGDFVNVPQAIIDQFLVSARSKWDQYTALVMLLPHGYEGQGPEHSSARLERFLQQVAEDNLRIANCTTAAQYFHILRRQACLLSLDPRPLILMAPKSLLRNPLAASAVHELTNGAFRPILPDASCEGNPEAVRRLVLCSGKVYYDLLAARDKDASGPPTVALTRVEELYPFPAEGVAEVLDRYPKLEEVAWVQEEPRNMGAWTFVAPRIRDILGRRFTLQYIGRTRRASPSEGSHHWHVREQNLLVQAAVRFGSGPIKKSLKREVEHAG